MGRSTFDLNKSRDKLTTMNKLLFLAFFSVAFFTLSYGEVNVGENALTDTEFSQLRAVREADPKKGSPKNKRTSKKKKRTSKKKKRTSKKKNNTRKVAKKSKRKTNKNNNKTKKKTNKKNGNKSTTKKKRNNNRRASKNNGKKSNKKNKKAARKSLKKKKRANKKITKSKKGKVKKGKRNNRTKKNKRKSAKKGKKNNRKAANKNNKTARKVNTGRQGDSCDTSIACIGNATFYYELLQKRVRFFNQQKERIKVFYKQSNGKLKKKDVFNDLINRLREASGGNSSNVTCNGEVNEGSKNIEELMTKLGACSDNINTACNETEEGPKKESNTSG